VALERRGAGVYFYATRRVGGRVVKKYRGAGWVAEFAARLADIRRLETQLDLTDRRIRRDDLRDQNAALRAWFAAADRLVFAALESAGWHRARRQLRKRRGPTVGALLTVDELPWVSSDLAARAGAIDPDVTAKASKGDKAALRAVDEFLDNPAARALWGDTGRHVLAKWVEVYAGANVVQRRAVVRFASDLRARLAGPNPSALGTLIAERVVLGWLFVSWAEYQYAGHLAGLKDLKLSTFYLKRVEFAHRNLMSACRTLAKVRRAELPSVLALVNVTAPAAVDGTG